MSSHKRTGSFDSLSAKIKPAFLPRFSVIVPVKNREKHIADCLESLLAMDYPDFEVIVVDNGSNDKTAEIATNYPVKLIQEPHSGAYTARNTGIRASSGEIIAFTDSDCVVDKAWLRYLAPHFKSDKVAGAGGSLLPLGPKTLIEEFLSLGPLRIFHAPRATVMQCAKNRFLSGALGSANMSYRRIVLNEVQGFDGEFKTFCGAYDLCWRVQRAGYDVIYEPEAIISHQLRKTLGGLCTQFFLFGQCQPHLLKKQPEGQSYISIRTHLFPVKEIALRSPVRMLLDLDILYLVVLGVILAFLHPGFLFAALPLAALCLAGFVAASLKIVKRTGCWKWLVIFPLLHAVRKAAFTLGRFVGGIKRGVLSF